MQELPARTLALPGEGSLGMLGRSLVMFSLLFFPFQDFLVNQVENESLAQLLRFFDEILVLGLGLPWMMTLLAQGRGLGASFGGGLPAIGLWVFLFASVISILLKRVPPLQGVFGIFDLGKAAFTFFLVQSIPWTGRQFRRAAQYALVGLLILAGFGVLGEFLALAGIENDWVEEKSKSRLGLYRIVSLPGHGHTNFVGLACVLGIALVPSLARTWFTKIPLFLILFAAVVFSGSRQALIGLFFMSAIRGGRGILIGAIILGFLGAHYLSLAESYDPQYYYRAFTYLKSLEALQDNPILGVGPGMFCGVPAAMMGSPYHQTWPVFFAEMFEEMGSLDSYWPGVFAEVGLVGGLALVLALVGFGAHIRLAERRFQAVENYDIAHLVGRLRGFLLGMVVMGFLTGLNKPFVSLTFFLLAGIACRAGERYARLR
ncbi:MAG: hypothetical protein DWQ01_18015 [Planctomycetota bacterium]|nr:MAG: hypothetical protein DWQ01_18015 [Planctomycetota bacterium]